MKLQTLAFLCAILYLTSCSSGDDKTQTNNNSTLLILNVDPVYRTTDSDNWIIIHDSDGNSIEYQSFEAGDKIEVTTEKTVISNTITVTIADYSHYTYPNYKLTTYTGIAKGRTFNLKPLEPAARQNTGNLFTVNVDDIYVVRGYSLTSKYASAHSIKEASSSVQIDSYVSVDASKYILQLYDGYKLRYQIWDNVEAGKTYNLSFDDMKTFDQWATFTYPENSTGVSLKISGAENLDALAKSPYVLFNHPNEYDFAIQAGYLNMLPVYTIDMEVNYDAYSLVFHKIGESIAGSPIWPHLSNYSISSNSITSFSARGEMVIRRSVWKNADLLTWTINSGQPSQVIKDMPSGLLGEHPALSLGSMTHVKSTLFPYVSFNQTYVDYIDDIFGGKAIHQEEWTGIALP